MNKEKTKLILGEILENIIILKEYYRENQKYENAAKIRDIEMILKSMGK